MGFRYRSDGIRLHHPSHQGHDEHGASAAPWLDSSQHSAIDTGDNSAAKATLIVPREINAARNRTCRTRRV